MHEATRYALEQELKHLTRRAESEQRIGDELGEKVCEHHKAAEASRQRVAQITADLNGLAANDDAPAVRGERGSAKQDAAWATNQRATDILAHALSRGEVTDLNIYFAGQTNEDLVISVTVRHRGDVQVGRGSR